ncbi:MAG: Hsp20/alpha crystallin family protein [Desulfobulbus sp.]|nr:MAG: Hsp20/alpha crystallin family protein [Desulfobulbus sp.]RUM41606.1 MAG: Hsp20/alpha crystallin family protein [Desulfobulbus sp.]
MGERANIVAREETMPERSIDIPQVVPLVDIYENDDEILLFADMPGVNKDDITINIDNGTLSLDGVRKMEISGAVQWEEFGEAQYQRTFSVPQTIDVAKVSAEMQDGVLRLHLPKSEAAKPRQIEIKTA